MHARRTFLRYTLQSALFIFCLALLGSFRTDTGILEAVVKKLQEFHARNTQEKLYVQLDKPFYVAGDSIWFKAYLVEASLHNLDSQSRVMYVELLNTANQIIQRKTLYANGIAFGDFALPDTLQEGKYLIRAYTNYMRNCGDDFFFKKELSILNPTPAYASRIQPPMENPDSIDLQFFPEGGEVVAFGKFNRIAFKAIGQNGRGAFVEGEILDDQQAKVATFKTEHDGMGLLWLNPEAGKSYHAKIIKPHPSERSYPLPSVKDKGYVLQVNQASKKITVIAFSNVSSEPVPVGVIVQCRGNVYHVQEGTIKPEGFFTTLASDKFPEGINQVTLFDAAGRPVAERLIYIQHNESLALKLTVDSGNFKPRERITVYADAAYPNGKPALGNFSITVYDDVLVPNIDKYPVTIKNYLSLTSDLKGYVESPGYYFKDALPETRKNLDLLMLVHGWRRFTWKDVLDTTDAKPFVRERGIPISGRIMKAIGKKPLPGSMLKIMTMQGNVILVTPDTLGYFYNDDLLFYDSLSMVIQVENEKGKKHPNKFLLDPVDPPASSYHAMQTFTPFEAPDYVKRQTEKNSLDKSIKSTMLQELKVTAKRPDPVLESKMTGFIGNAIKVGRDVGKYYNNVFDLLDIRQQPGVQVSRIPTRGYVSILIRGKPPVSVTINGRESSWDEYAMISAEYIEYMEIDKMRYTVNLVLSESYRQREPIGMSRIKIAGLYQAREFYSPRYDVPHPRHTVADKRITLYWEPVVETDSLGRAAVSFFAADASSRYRIVMEGITPDGCAGTATATFSVK